MFYDHEEDRLATPADAMREFAENVGGTEHNAKYAWLLTDYDVWVRNPHYVGPPQRHPEDYDLDEEGMPAPAAPVREFPRIAVEDEDIPF
jgi:hypothetical protein